MLKADFAGQKISWFRDRLVEGKLEYKPPFQRNPVWRERHKAYLIDTVLRGLPIPEIYMQTETDTDGKTVYSIVDGQQRVRTVLEFPDGKLTLSEEHTPGRDGQTWGDLTANEKVAYWNYRLVVREITDGTDDQLRDLFRRLNANTVQLNAQEIRNARYKGEFITEVTRLADQEFWSEHKIVSANEIRRMVDIEFVAELLVGLIHGPQNKKSTLDRFFESYEENFPDKQKWLSRFEAARACTEALVPDLKSTRWRGKSDYYSLFLACAAVGENRRLAKLDEGRARLKQFGEAITKLLGKGSQRARKATHGQYAEAVEKAASDRDRRQTRHEILVDLLKPFFI